MIFRGSSPIINIFSNWVGTSLTIQVPYPVVTLASESYCDLDLGNFWHWLLIMNSIFRKKRWLGGYNPFAFTSYDGRVSEPIGLSGVLESIREIEDFLLRLNVS